MLSAQVTPALSLVPGLTLAACAPSLAASVSLQPAAAPQLPVQPAA